MKWKKTLAERFWEKVDKRGPDECWPWIGALAGRSGQKRGQLWDGSRVVPAPQVSLRLHGVKIGRRWALHSCNNPGCVNPRHLYAGDRLDNARDAIAAGTLKNNPAPLGEANYCAKLKSSDIAPIRLANARGESLRSIAGRLSVSKEAVRKVVRGETWTHV